MNEVQTTARGFQFVEFHDAGGEVCDVQISSAEDDTGGLYKLWLGCKKLAGKTWVPPLFGGYGKWVDLEVPPLTVGTNQMHLSMENAKYLRGVLDAYIESGGVFLKANEYDDTTHEADMPAEGTFLPQPGHLGSSGHSGLGEGSLGVQEDINRSVALAMGYSGLEAADVYISEVWPGGLSGERYAYVMTHGGWFGWPPGARQYDTEFGRESPDKEPVPDFCADPAAAALVFEEIERRGWEWLVGSHHYGTQYWDATVRHQGYPDSPEAFCDQIATSEISPWHAICLAFLAACDAIGGL